MACERGDSNAGGVKGSAKAASGTYNNYYKTAQDAKGNPTGYSNATLYVSKALKELGLSNDWLEPTLELVARESSFNPNAKNKSSTAAGLFQFLDGTRKNYGGSSVDWSDPYQQTLAGLKYIKDRYSNPENALEFWDKNKWY